MRLWPSLPALARVCITVFLSVVFTAGCTHAAAQHKSAPSTTPQQSVAVADSIAALAAPPSPVDIEFAPEAFLANIALLASDTLEGRGTGTHGGDLAAGFIAGKFAAAGLQPGGDGGTYFQEFTPTLGTDLGDDTQFVISGLSEQPQRGRDYLPFSFSSNDAFAGELLFAGYGQVNTDKNYDDYGGIDAQGKVLLLFRKEPPGWGENGQYSPHATFNDKIYTAKEHGAAAVLVVNQSQENAGEDRLARFGSLGGGGVFGLPAFQLSRAFAEKLAAAGGLPALDELQKKLDETGENCSQAISDLRIEGKAGIVARKARTQNVIGVLPAHGDKADEYVVIGAHYDHLGKVVAGSMQPSGYRGRDESELVIHNGADDNASGVSGVIELGRALSHTPHLRRSIVFMAFTGEEWGLYGSKYYVEHPTVPLEQIVAMINLDMIGRLRPDRTTIPVYGAESAPELKDIVSRTGAAEGFGSEGMAGSLDASDHASFAHKGIPYLFFFTDKHADYHMPTDDTEKINAEGGARITRMIYDITLQVTNADGRPTYHEVASAREVRPGAAVMRVSPSYVEDDQPGMLLDGVASGGPAEAAGIKPGDRILRIGDKEVKNVYDYMAALRDKKPGDQVEVLIRRGEEGLSLTVKLGGRERGQ